LQVLSGPEAVPFANRAAVELARVAVIRGSAAQAWQLLSVWLGDCSVKPDFVMTVLMALYEQQEYQQVRIRLGT
jgi:hypothetical protein